MDSPNESVFLATGGDVPEAFHERRCPRPFRIVYISLQAFLERFLLRRRREPDVLPVKCCQSQAPASSPSEKSVPWKCGVPRLDEQNAALFKLIRQFQSALKYRAESGVTEEALSSLVSHVEGHLALEEAYLSQIAFPGLAEHRAVHQAFQHQLQEFRHRMADRDPSAALELSQQLFAWLRVHVVKEDSVWSEYAKARRRH
jgi:hemerythrin